MKGSDRHRGPERGEILGSALFSAALVFGIFAQVLYLTKDLGWRWDLTQEKLYSLSGSTKKVLARLDQGLVIEAYFSKDVPGVYKVDRDKISHMLDEYEKMGHGRIKVVYFDPLEDEGVRDKASRLGITEAQATDVKDDSIQAVRFYQGVRIRYGGDKQKILPLVQNASTIESQITPVIRELVTDRKPKVGILSRAPGPQTNPFMRNQPQPRFSYLERVIRDRYDIVTVDMSQGQELPEDLDILVVVAPKDLTDWEKYCIDQHVMRGGNMVVYEEAADYSIDQFASFYRTPFQIDKPDAKLTWKKQLAAYGVDLSDKLVADMEMRVGNLAIVVVRGAGGGQGIRQMWKPYWFNAVAFDWNRGDPAKKLGPGIDTKHATLAGMKSLSFFWGTGVDLADPLPQGVEGHVLARTSPLGLAEDPPQSTAPAQTIPALKARLEAQRRQIAMVVTVKGKFTSAWKGMDMPKRPLPESDKNGGLYQDPAQEQGAPAKKPAEQAKKPEEQAKKQGAPATKPAPAGAPEKTGGEAEQGKPIGPPKPGAEKKAEDEKNKLLPRLDVAKKEGRILVVGDASMVRDDFLGGLPPFGIPRSAGGIELYQNALDWLALDTDLVELRNKRDVDRKLVFVETDPSSSETIEELKSRIAAKKKWYRWLNVLGPVVLLLGAGAFLWSKRSGEKRSFLAAQER